MRFSWLVLFTACASAPHAHDHDHRRFEDAAHWAKRFDDPARDAWQQPKVVVQLMELKPSDRVADLGAGTGYFLPHLSPAVPQGQVMGLDIEASMVDWMKARISQEKLTNVEARQVAPDDPGLATESVEAVLIVDTWHHIADRITYGRKLLGALTPGGRIYVVDFTEDSPHGPPHRISAETVAKELTEIGLSTKIVEEPLPFQYLVVGVKNP